MAYTADGVVPFPLLPDWGQRVSESLEFHTRVLGPTLTGLRQKRRMRIAPRRSFGFEVHASGNNRRLIDNIRFGQGIAQWLLPIWHDRQSFKTELPAGSIVIDCDTVSHEFGRYAMIRHRDLNTPEFEVVEILGVMDGRLALAAPTVNTWAAGSRLYALRKAVFDEFPKSSNLTSNVMKLPVRFAVDEPCDYPEYSFPETYLGWPVWEFKHDWAVARALGFDRIVETIDNGTALPQHFDLPSVAFVSYNMRWVARSRAEHNLLRSVLYALAGRYRSVWLPTRLPDLALASDIGSADTALTVQACGYTVFGKQQVGRRDIRIELKDGTTFHRRITGSADAGATETLTIDGALGVAVDKEDVRMISFMSLAQQASDSIDLTHETDADGVTTAVLVFEGVIDPTEAPASDAPDAYADETGAVYVDETAEAYIED